jgi:F0F1-type ATP synthase assembly protein I
LFYVCKPGQSHYYAVAMNFALAFLTFVLFAFFLGWGIVLLMNGTPWLFIAALLVFVGAFAKFGCLSQ